jgi:hypothetical protein
MITVTGGSLPRLRRIDPRDSAGAQDPSGSERRMASSRQVLERDARASGELAVPRGDHAKGVSAEQ